MSHGHEVVIKGASRNYGALAALDNFDLTIEPGKFTVLLGPSGSGKSTLIRSMAGIERLNAGEIYFGEKKIAAPGFHLAPEKRDLAMVFQDYALWPHMSALENVAYALKRRHLDSVESARRAHEALDRVGLFGKEKNYPFELSGGEQQRVALARAIVGRPALLLFDEPLSNLDADLRERLRVEIATLTREIGATACYITHDQSEAFALADEIGIMRSGKLQQLASPETIYQHPANRFVASFTGIAATFNGRVKEIRGKHIMVDLGSTEIECRATTEIEVGSDVEILVRPAATSFEESKKNTIPASILDIAYRGRGYEHVVECQYGILTGVFAQHSVPRGTRVDIHIEPKNCLAFPLEHVEK